MVVGKKKGARHLERRRADSLSPNRASALVAWQSKYGQRPAERGIGRETRIATDGTEARGVDSLLFGRQLALIDRAMPGGGVFGLQQAGRQAYAGPAADAGKHGNILLPTVLIGHDAPED